MSVSKTTMQKCGLNTIFVLHFLNQNKAFFVGNGTLPTKGAGIADQSQGAFIANAITSN